MDFWPKIELAEQKWLGWQAGRLKLWARQKDGDVQLGYSYQEALKVPAVLENMETPDETTRIRLVAEKPIKTIALTPSLPDRPIVVATRMPIRLLARQSALFYLGIPVWVKIVTVSSPDLVLAEIPTEVLSNTWYGTGANGVLCYSVDSYLLRQIDKEIMLPHYALCPVRVRNASRGNLDFRKISIYTPYLNCYYQGQELWTNQVQATFISDTKINISVSASPPKTVDHGDRPELLTRQREYPDRNILKKSFTILREVTRI